MQKTTKIIVTHVIVGVILILTFIAVKMIGSSKKSAFGMPGMMPPANSMAGGGAGGGAAKPGSSTSKEAAAGNGTSGAGAGNANGGTGMSTNGAGKNGMAGAGNTMPGNANSNTSGKKSQTVTPVRTVVANEVILQDYVMTSGDIQTQTSIEVFPSIGGTVVQMNVSLGSPVKKGDVIGYIDPSEPGSY